MVYGQPNFLIDKFDGQNVGCIFISIVLPTFLVCLQRKFDKLKWNIIKMCTI